MPTKTTEGAPEAPKKKRGRAPGSPKSGGRKAGTPNRNSATVLASLNAANFPLVEMLIADISFLEPAQRVTELKWLFKFCYPELRSIDLPASPGAPAPEPASTPATATPPAALSPQQRRNAIHGYVARKPEAPGE